MYLGRIEVLLVKKNKLISVWKDDEKISMNLKLTKVEDDDTSLSSKTTEMDNIDEDELFDSNWSGNKHFYLFTSIDCLFISHFIHIRISSISSFFSMLMVMFMLMRTTWLCCFNLANHIFYFSNIMLHHF